MLKEITIIPVERTIPSRPTEECSQYTHPRSQASVETQHFLQVLVLSVLSSTDRSYLKMKVHKN